VIVMPDPTATSYFGIPGFIVLWAIAIVAFFLFVHRVLHWVGILRLARPERRWDHVLKRLAYVVKNVFGQSRLLKEPAFGLAHFFIFWAFVFYAGSFFWNLVRGLFPFLPLPYADEIPLIAFAMELLTVIALVAIVGAALRRYFFTPPRLERTFDASLVLGLITILLVTFLAGQGFKSVAEEHAVAWSPAGNALGRGFAAAGVDPDSALTLYLSMWWLHMVTVLFFLAYLPYSKHAHLLFAPFGVFFTALRPGGMPPPSEGAARLGQFTWRQLYNALSCAECGRCDRACPAYNSGFPLSPKDVIHGVKELLRSVDRAAVRLGTSASPAGAGGGNGGASGTRLLEERVTAAEVWACTTCMACMQLCPVFNEHIPLVTEMRRYMVSEGDVEERLQEVMLALTRYGNSFGKSPRARPKWTQGLDFKIKDARKESVEYLWFVGDYASYDPRLAEATRATARVFHRAGLDFGILYDGEQNSGNDIRRTGEEGLFEMLREKNIQTLSKANFLKIVTTDPHTYHALKNEYANGDGTVLGEKEVLHYTELLDRLMGEGRLPLNRSPRARVTYHDPCYLGRYNRVYREPRRILRKLGVDLAEMPRNRDNSYCCGAGGGRIWMEDVAGVEERPAESRVREAADLKGVDTLVVSCPKDLVMFQDAVKTKNLEDRLVVRDLIELLEEAARPSDVNANV
jgi:Fe-S oxidoreductase/uncharacterized membrane protein